ncbi:MAG: hypothetical protein DRP64_06300 [Verrucomicrobia bacterium]|nr:MAG: hypothetical protein DRP64_06300 [Verrucomicrobiota bacterium]
MDKMNPKLSNAPIVEAVVDIDCDMPTTFEVENVIEQATALFKESYPKTRKRYVHQHEIKQKIGGDAEISSPSVEVQALQLLQEDEKQIIQVRSQGYSFNRLAPYTSMDEYWEEIRGTWQIFAETFNPTQVQRVRLRFINRIFLPLDGGSLDFDDYLKVAPRLTDDVRLAFNNFINQHQVQDVETGNTAKIVLATQAEEKGTLPILFDIEVIGRNAGDVSWDFIGNELEALRNLKNHIFYNTLTDKCLTQFN